MAKKKSSNDTLSWREGRATPTVVKDGKATSKDSGGKVIASRKATDAEQKKINKGRWIDTRPPGQANKKSSVRPQQAKKQKNKKTDKG